MARNKFDVDEELDQGFNFKHVIRILKYVRPFRGKMSLVVLMMIIASLLGLLGPYLVKDAIDNRIPNGDYRGLAITSSIFLISLVINAICLMIRIRYMSQIGQSIIQNVRKDLFTHLQVLPFSYYDSRPHGKILVRVVNYVNSLSDLLSNGIVNMITDLFSLIFIVGFMLFINVNLTLICLAGIPFLVFGAFLIKTTQRKAWQAVSRKQSNMNAYLHESICGIKVTQSFAREDVNLGIFEKLNSDLIKQWMNACKIQFLMGPIVDNISMVVIAAVYMAGISWISTGVTVGVLIAFIGYISRFWGPIANLSNFYNQIVIAAAYLERIFETMDEKPLVDNIPNASTMPQIIGNVEFKNVNFSYDAGSRILNDVSFDIKAGNSTALVGPTGAGKTTIVNLLSRFYDLENGELLIDGVNIKNVTLDSLRKQMGVMLQDTFIFSGTILDNIRYGKLDATDEQVIEASKAVKAHDFILTLKEGYNTQVNERGSRLSVGQRQLISFARALLADPRILILDEATSSIDTKTEMALQEGLERLLKGRTSFIIAHRLSTIKSANRIMYIDKGQIVEMGTHDELMCKKGEYYKLYMAQFSFLDAG